MRMRISYKKTQKQNYVPATGKQTKAVLDVLSSGRMYVDSVTYDCTIIKRKNVKNVTTHIIYVTNNSIFAEVDLFNEKYCIKFDNNDDRNEFIRKNILPLLMTEQDKLVLEQFIK